MFRLGQVVHLITDQKMIRPGVGGKETLRCVQNINKNMHYGSVYEARAGIVTVSAPSSAEHKH